MNAKQEFLKHVGSSGVICAEIQLNDATYRLLINYTIEELNTFLQDINQKYDNGFGGQELDGTIWFTNGTWSDRREYDGSEWWERHIRPNCLHLVK